MIIRLAAVLGHGLVQSTIATLSFMIIVSGIHRFNKIFVNAPNLRIYHTINKIPYFNENELFYTLLYFGFLFIFTLIGFTFGEQATTFITRNVSIILCISILFWLVSVFLGFLIGFLKRNQD